MARGDERTERRADHCPSLLHLPFPPSPRLLHRLDFLALARRPPNTQQFMAEIAGREESEGSDSEEHSDDDAEEEEEERAAEEEQEEEPSATTEQDERIELAPSAEAEPSLASLSLDPPAASDDEDEDELASDAESTTSSTFSTALTDMGTHRRHRPSTKRTTPDVSSIVQNKLAKSKSSTERKHHGKKAVTANILGRQKGSKKKQDKTREIKDASGGGW